MTEAPQNPTQTPDDLYRGKGVYGITVNALLHMTPEHIAEAFEVCEGRSKRWFPRDGGFGSWTEPNGNRVFVWTFGTFMFGATCLADGSRRVLGSHIESYCGDWAAGPSPLSAHYRSSPVLLRKAPVPDEVRTVPADFNLVKIMGEVVDRFGWATVADKILSYVRSETAPSDPPFSGFGQLHTRTEMLDNGVLNICVVPAERCISVTTLVPIWRLWQDIANAGLMEGVGTHADLARWAEETEEE